MPGNGERPKKVEQLNEWRAKRSSPEKEPATKDNDVERALDLSRYETVAENTSLESVDPALLKLAEEKANYILDRASDQDRYSAGSKALELLGSLDAKRLVDDINEAILPTDPTRSFPFETIVLAWVLLLSLPQEA
jgi:hypothetical protein